MAGPFDPYKQDVVFHDIDRIPFNVSIDALNEFVQYNTMVCINYGSQLGASIILILLVALLTPPDKRRSPVFILNSSALVMNAARLLCMSIYFTTAFSEVYTYFSGDFSKVPTSAYADSILGVVCSLLLVICIEASLIIQTQVVCTTLTDFQRQVLLAVSFIFASVPIGFRFALTIENAKYIALAEDFSRFIWLQSAANIALTISVCFFSIVFVTKLGFAIHSRRRLGLTRFGAMQVIFVMSCQTMTIPGKIQLQLTLQSARHRTNIMLLAVCSIIQYFIPVSEMNSNVLTLVAVSLPLSSLWAAAATRHSFETVNSSRQHHLWTGASHNTNTPNDNPKGNPSSQSITARANSTAPTLTPEQLDRMYPELETGNGISVERKFSIHNLKW